MRATPSPRAPARRQVCPDHIATCSQCASGPLVLLHSQADLAHDDAAQSMHSSWSRPPSPDSRTPGSRAWVTSCATSAGSTPAGIAFDTRGRLAPDPRRWRRRRPPSRRGCPWTAAWPVSATTTRWRAGSTMPASGPGTNCTCSRPRPRPRSKPPSSGSAGTAGDFNVQMGR